MTTKHIYSVEAAAILNRNINTVIRYCSNGKLKAEFVTDPPPRRWLITLESVEKLLADEAAIEKAKAAPAVAPSAKVRPPSVMQNSIIRTHYPKQVKEENDRRFHERLAAFVASGRQPHRLPPGVVVLERDN